MLENTKNSAATPFVYDGYKPYLLALEESGRIFRRGFRGKLAAAVGCNAAYISHVLNGNAHLSCEQALRAAELLELSGKERDFFLLLVQQDRAGTQDLRSYYRDQLEKQREQFQNLSSRVKSDTLSEEISKSIFFSSWEYAAVQLLLTIPTYRQIPAIQERLKLSSRKVRKILRELVDMRLAKKEEEEYFPLLENLHLDRKSRWIRQHHTNWRFYSLAALQGEPSEHEQRYSSVISLSRKDALKLRSKLVEFLAELDPLISASPAEELYTLCVDFFPV